MRQPVPVTSSTSNGTARTSWIRPHRQQKRRNPPTTVNPNTTDRWHFRAIVAIRLAAGSRPDLLKLCGARENRTPDLLDANVPVLAFGASSCVGSATNLHFRRLAPMVATSCCQFCCGLTADWLATALRRPLPEAAPPGERSARDLGHAGVLEGSLQ